MSEKTLNNFVLVSKIFSNNMDWTDPELIYCTRKTLSNTMSANKIHIMKIDRSGSVFKETLLKEQNIIVSFFSEIKM